MADEYLTEEQKEQIRRRNDNIRDGVTDEERENIRRLNEFQRKLRSMKRAVRPTALGMLSEIIKKTTGRDPSIFVVRNGIGSMRKRLVAHKGMREVGSRALGLSGVAPGISWRAFGAVSILTALGYYYWRKSR